MVKTICGIILQHNQTESRMQFPMPSNFSRKRVVRMSTMEVLTLLLVIFAALSYIDKKK